MIIPNIWKSKKCSKPPISTSWLATCLLAASSHFVSERQVLDDPTASRSFLLAPAETNALLLPVRKRNIYQSRC